MCSLGPIYFKIVVEFTTVKYKFAAIALTEFGYFPDRILFHLMAREMTGRAKRHVLSHRGYCATTLLCANPRRSQ